MADPIPVPVGILRLPRGPDSSGSRGFTGHRHRDLPGSRDISRDISDSRHHSPDISDSRDISRAISDSRHHCPDIPGSPAISDSPDISRDAAAAQRARAALRERFLRLLGRARGKRSRFRLCTGLSVRADFGAADVQSGAFQVDSLLTPLGVQASALLRSGDVLEFSFPLE